MDYTKIPPQLICKERRNLEDFAVANNLNTIIVDNMVDFRYFQGLDFKVRALRCLNAAYYICTLIQAEEHPEWSLSYYYSIADCENKSNEINQAVTISLVCIYIHWFDKDWLQNHKKLINKLDGYLKENYIDNNTPFPPSYTYRDVYNELSQNITKDILIPVEEFSLRKIDKEAIEDLQATGFSWTKFTDYYSYNIMDDIVFTLGKNVDEQILLQQSFEHDAKIFYGERSNYYHDTISKRLDSLWRNIWCDNHMDEEENKLRLEIFEAEMSQLDSNASSAPLRARVSELEAEVKRLKEENAVYKDKFTQHETVDKYNNEDENNIVQQIAEKEHIIQEQQRLIEDYSARFDPRDLRKKKFLAMTGKQHIILILAVLAYNDRLPNSRRSMSFLMSFIASRNESTMEDYLGDAISNEECETLAKVFDNEKQPFLASIIRQLPDKLERDKLEKNRTKALKKHNE